MAAATPGPAADLDLLSTYRAALERQASSLAVSELEALALRESAREELADWLPDLFVDGFVGRATEEVRAPEVPFTIEGRNSFDVSGYAVTFRQTLYDHAELLDLRRARERIALSSLEIEQERSELALLSARLYLEALNAEGSVELFEREAAAASRLLELVGERVEGRLEVATVGHEARSRMRLVEAELQAARSRFRKARAELAALIGSQFGELAPLESQPPTAPQAPGEAWLEEALRSNLELQRRQAAVEITAYEVRRERAELLPSAHFQARLVDLDQDGTVAGPPLRTEDSEALLQLRVPIFEGGRALARARAAARLRDAAKWRLQARELALRERIPSLLDELEAERERLDALEDVASASALVAQQTEESYAAGLQRSLDVFDAQQRAYRAQRDLSDARHNLWLLWLELQRLTDGLDERDLERLQGASG